MYKLQTHTYAWYIIISQEWYTKPKKKAKCTKTKNQKPRVKCTIWYNNHETQLKMGSKHQALLANEQRLLDPKVRWRYRQRCQSLIILEWPLLVLQIFQIKIVHVVLCYWCGKSSDTLINMYSIGVTTTTTTDTSPDRLDKVSVRSWSFSEVRIHPFQNMLDSISYFLWAKVPWWPSGECWDTCKWSPNQLL